MPRAHWRESNSYAAPTDQLSWRQEITWHMYGRFQRTKRCRYNTVNVLKVLIMDTLMARS